MNRDLLLGARFGFNFHPANVNVVGFGANQLMVEARATWMLGTWPSRTLRPFALLGVGASDLTTSFGTASPNVTAWRLAGPVFATTGVGIRFEHDRFALMFAPLKITAAFGGATGVAYAPEIAATAAIF